MGYSIVSLRTEKLDHMVSFTQSDLQLCRLGCRQFLLMCRQRSLVLNARIRWHAVGMFEQAGEVTDSLFEWVDRCRASIVCSIPFPSAGSG